MIDGPLLPTLDELEMRYIRHVLERVEGNKRRAAALLGIGRRTLYRRLGEQEQDDNG
jgi:two-component system, NtrC family, response regulator AtoC